MSVVSFPKPPTQNLVDVRRFSVLNKLVKTVAWIWRSAKKFIQNVNQTADNPKWEAVLSSQVISASEREDALRDIFLAAQQGAFFPSPPQTRWWCTVGLGTVHGTFCTWYRFTSVLPSIDSIKMTRCLISVL